MTQSKKVRWVRLGEFIEQLDLRNRDNSLGCDDVRGISVDKVFTPTKANLDGVSLSSYKVVPPFSFAYVPDTSRRGDKIALAYNDTEDSFLISSIYTTFHIFNNSVLPAYLYIWFARPDFNRFARFNSWGSARETLDWDDFTDIEIPVPYKDGKLDVERQKEVVDIWQGLRRLKEDNEALAAPLLELCQAKMDELKHSAPMVELGEYIHRIDERNKDNKIRDVKGISVTKEYREPTSKVDLSGNLSAYKIVRYNQFGFIQTTNNEKRLVVSLSKFKNPILISSVNEVFEVNSEIEIIPDFLQLWFLRPEVDRYGRFHSWGSARETFTWNDMCRMKIPKPSIEVQRAIVDIYHCARRAKEIAEEASQHLKTICPALMQHIIHS